MTNPKQAQMYFKLFACCVAVKGAVRSTICDMQRGEIKLIPNSLYTILTEHQHQTYSEIQEVYDYDETLDEYFEFLVENELGFWTDTPEFFPPLDMTWQTYSSINNAIIDIDAASTHDFKAIFAQLEELGCDHIQLRYYTDVSKDTLEHHLESTKRSRFKSIELVVKYGNLLDIPAAEALVVSNARIHKLVLHGAPESDIRPVMKPGTDFSLGQMILLTYEITSADHCGVIDPFYFSIDTKTMTESHQFNTCLNKKIGIDAQGEIKNCPSLTESFGNIAQVSLHQAMLQKDFKKLWEINKNQVEICKDCEFRHICTDCRAFIQNPENVYSKPSKCNYDPYTASWSNP
ncbi:grasp-with-spasm system SPASM domain peptide maturase [Microscilla marina]|nr:grasp-with-spasm system SPASM domain peptide maturase [Microscilla marina]